MKQNKHNPGQGNIRALALLEHLDIFPYIAVRYSGVSPSGFYRLVFSGTKTLLQRCMDLEGLCETVRNPLCAMLEKVIGSGLPATVKFELISLKRDLFNDRQPRKELSEEARSILKGQLSSNQNHTLQQWLDQRRQRNVLLQQAEEEFRRELASGRTILKRLFSNTRFRKGLAIASPTLNYELDSYVQAHDGAIVRRINQTESSLLRYYTRCAFKLSPFSTFMHTGVVQVSEIEGPRVGRIKSSVKLNRAFVAELAASLSRHDEIRDHALLALTGTLSQIPRASLVLRRKPKTSGSQTRLRIPDETVVKIADCTLIEWVIAFFDGQPKAVPRRKMIQALQEVLGREAEAIACVDKLVELGVLVQKIPIPEDDSSGVMALCDFLADIPSNTARQARASLLHLESLTQKLARSNRCARVETLREIETAANEAFACHSSAGKWNGAVSYEDSINDRFVKARLPKESEIVIQDLQQFLSCCGGLMDDNVFHRTTLAHVFQDSLNGPAIPLLGFAQNWINALNGTWPHPHFPLSSHELNPCNLAVLNRLLALRSELGSAIAQASEQEEVDLHRIAWHKEWPHRFTELNLDNARIGPSWFSCYCQSFVAIGDSAGLVINNVTAGPLRPLLYSLSGVSDPELRGKALHDLRTALEQAYFPAEPCQLLATFDYNAKLAANVTRRIINYADDLSAVADDSIELGSLEVATQNGMPVLVDRISHAQLAPLDSGMMAAGLQPPVYRLLLVLGGVADVPLRFFEPYLWRNESDAPRTVEHFPRIKFGTCILRRRGWSIPVEMLPQRRNQERDFQYYARVRQWQRSLGLPDEVFVRAASLLEWKNQTLQSRDRQTWNRRKPQYIHFGNYFLIELFEKAVQETRTRLYVEEMLPDQKSWSGSPLRRPSEFVLDARCRYGKDKNDSNGLLEQETLLTHA